MSSMVATTSIVLEILKSVAQGHSNKVVASDLLRRWNEVSKITVAACLTGAIWFVKSQGDYLKDVVMAR